MNILSKKSTPLLATLLLGVLIVSCSTTSHVLLNNAQNFIKSEQYDSTLAAANRYIQKFPRKPLGYFYKAEALGLKASNIDIDYPQKATPLYKKMARSFTKVKQISDTIANPPKVLQRIKPFKTTLWRKEHNLGVNFAVPKDSLHNTVPNPLEIAIGHLRNATTIMPGKAMSWNALAQVSSMKKNYKEAAKAQKQFLSLKADSSTTSRNYLVLAQYYNQSNQPHKALPVLQKVHRQYPDSIKPVEMLADTYNKLGKSEKSIALVKELVQKDPSNGRYRLSLGTHIYRKELKIQDKYDNRVNKLITLTNKLITLENNGKGKSSQAEQLQSKINKLKAKNAALKQKMDALIQRSLKQIHAAIENGMGKGKSGANVYFTLGVIYQNKAHVIFEKRNLTFNKEKRAQLKKKARAQLKNARDAYKKAAQIEPNNKKYWRSLYQIYTMLGNDQKANEVKQKAGIQG